MTSKLPNTRFNRDQAIAAHLEDIARAKIQAISDHDFSPSSPLFDAVSPDWEAVHDNGVRIDFSTWIEVIRSQALQHANYRLHIHDMETTVNNNSGTAKTFVNLDVVGQGEEISRPVMCIIYARRSHTDNQWLWAGHSSMTGIRL